ncbi:hypothetical protein D3C71_1780830 [compost metagenome]
MRAATAAAAPPEDPPMARVASPGFSVGPCKVGEVAMLPENSGKLVLPTMTMPAAL